MPAGITYAYEMERGTGIDGKHDGLVYKNLLASYSHFRSLQGYNWARRFVAHVRRVMAGGKTDGNDQLTRRKQ